MTNNFKYSKLFNKILSHPGFISEEDTALIFHNLDMVTERLNRLKELFPPSAIHTAAVKANPLFLVLKEITVQGGGLEAASLPELLLAKEADCKPDKLVFDSPVKTTAEIKTALDLGVHINADSFDDVERIARLLNQTPSKSTFGIRINPQVGTGKIEITSVGGQYSKFGIPLDEFRERLMQTYLQNPWLNGVHLHIGSQGCDIPMLVAGVKKVYDFVEELNVRISDKSSRNPIHILDLGGGLPVSYHHDEPAPDMREYVQALKQECPALFTDKYTLITEFGRYLHANAGWVISKVESVKTTKNSKTAMIHVGADLFLRECYHPEEWYHEISVLDSAGNLKPTASTSQWNIAGPLCFAGDIITKNRALPEISPGDFIVIHDTGAYSLSMWSRYNSRQIPKVLGCKKGEIYFIRERESAQDVIDFWK